MYTLENHVIIWLWCVKNLPYVLALRGSHERVIGSLVRNHVPKRLRIDWHQTEMRCLLCDSWTLLQLHVHLQCNEIYPEKFPLGKSLSREIALAHFSRALLPCDRITNSEKVVYPRSSSKKLYLIYVLFYLNSNLFFNKIVQNEYQGLTFRLLWNLFWCL